MNQSPLTGSPATETLSTTLPNRLPLPEKLNHTLLGLMIPSAIMVLNMSMFSVALPTMRDEFRVEPDQAAWLVAAYTLPFVIFTPLYGRLGDSLGKRRMLLFGILIYAVGAFLSLFAVDQRLIVIGRIARGWARRVNPLSIALLPNASRPINRKALWGHGVRPGRAWPPSPLCRRLSGRSLWLAGKLCAAPSRCADRLCADDPISAGCPTTLPTALFARL
ncbi:MAG: MFS transporter [Caldilineaceae bacterium]